MKIFILYNNDGKYINFRNFKMENKMFFIKWEGSRKLVHKPNGLQKSEFIDL